MYIFQVANATTCCSPLPIKMNIDLLQNGWCCTVIYYINCCPFYYLPDVTSDIVTYIVYVVGLLNQNCI